MTGRRGLPFLAAVLAGGLLTSCTGGGRSDPAAANRNHEATCTASVSSLLGVTQRYLDGLAGTSAVGSGSSPAAGSPSPAGPRVDEQEFASALDNVRAYASRKGCDPVAFQRDLAAGLATLKAGGPVAHAVLLQLRSSAATAAPAGTALHPGDDVAAALAAAPSGATVRLGPGTFTVGDTVAVLRGVTLQGAGRDATRLESAAAGGPLLVLAAEPVTLRGLTVRRTGTLPGPVVSAGPATTLVVRDARVSGARADRQGLGGVGILMSGGPGGQTGSTRRTSVTVTHSELSHNAVAGLVVAGEHRALIEVTVISGSAQCGVCFLGTSDGIVRGSSFVDDGAAVVAAGDSRPKVESTSVLRGQVGIQAVDRSAPEITGVTVTGAARAAMIWTATARGRVVGNRCVRVTFGIVVGPQALPFLGVNACQVVRGRQ